MNKVITRIQNYRFMITAIVLFSVFVSSACISETTVKKVTAFADGMDSVLEETTKAFELVEEKHLDRKTAILVNEYVKNQVAIRDFKVEPFFKKEIWESRMNVINGLKTYAATLKEVIGNEKLTEFDDSTKALGQKLVGINEQLVKENILNSKPVSDSELRIFTTAVNAIGRWFIDFKREKVTKQVIHQMNGAVNDVATLLAQDLGDKPYLDDKTSLNPRAKGLREKLWRNHTDIFNERNFFLSMCNDIARQEPALNDSQRTRALRKQCRNLYFSGNEMREEVKTLAEISSQRIKTDDMLAEVQKALLAIPGAHRNLEKAFDDKDVTLPMMISRLFEHAKHIKKFHDDLKEDKK